MTTLCAASTFSKPLDANEADTLEHDSIAFEDDRTVRGEDVDQLAGAVALMIVIAQNRDHRAGETADGLRKGADLLGPPWHVRSPHTASTPASDAASITLRTTASSAAVPLKCRSPIAATVKGTVQYGLARTTYPACWILLILEGSRLVLYTVPLNTRRTVREIARFSTK